MWRLARLGKVTIRYTTSEGEQKREEVSTDATRLWLVGESIASIDLSPLSRCSKLQLLWLHENQLQSIDLTPLSQCTSLRELGLDENQLQSIDLTPLSQLHNLQELGLCGNQLESVDVSPLFSCQELTTLYFDDGVELVALLSLQKADPVPSALRKLVEEERVVWLLSEEEQGQREIPTEHRAVTHSLPPSSELETEGKKGVLPDHRILEWIKSAMTSYEERRWRHAAVDAWTVVESLLSNAYFLQFGELKPRQLSYHQVIQKLAPHLPGGRLTAKALQQVLRLRYKIQPDSPDPTPEEAEQILVVAQQLCHWMELPLDRLMPRGVRILSEAVQELCPVCIAEVRAGQRVITTPCCQVDSHFEHLSEWVKTKGFCPKCRTPLFYRNGQVRTR